MLGFEYDYRSTDCTLEGIKIGIVVDNADPLCLERIRVRVIGVHDMNNEDKENSIWASHLAPSKSNSGEIPDIDDFVYIQFMDYTDPMSALWLGWVRCVN